MIATIRKGATYVNVKNRRRYVVEAIADVPVKGAKIVVYHGYLGMGRRSEETYWRFYEEFRDKFEEGE